MVNVIKEAFDRLVEWRAAAVADGWMIAPTYKMESQSSASILRKEGFIVQIITREKQLCIGGKVAYYSSIAAWGPDGLNIEPPEKYSMDELRRRLRFCRSCGREDVDTVRYSFAGRCCEDCLPKMRQQHERPGWTN